MANSAVSATHAPLQIVRVRDISHTNTDWHGRVLHMKEETEIFPDDSFIRIWQNEQDECYPLHWHNAFEIILPVENGYSVEVVIVEEFTDHLSDTGVYIAVYLRSGVGRDQHGAVE